MKRFTEINRFRPASTTRTRIRRVADKRPASRAGQCTTDRREPATFAVREDKRDAAVHDGNQRIGTYPNLCRRFCSRAHLATKNTKSAKNFFAFLCSFVFFRGLLRNMNCLVTAGRLRNDGQRPPAHKFFHGPPRLGTRQLPPPARGHDMTLLMGQQSTWRGERQAGRVETFTTTANLLEKFRALSGKTSALCFTRRQ